jgi:hypothetical protein
MAEQRGLSGTAIFPHVFSGPKPLRSPSSPQIAPLRVRLRRSHGRPAPNRRARRTRPSNSSRPYPASAWASCSAGSAVANRTLARRAGGLLSNTHSRPLAKSRGSKPRLFLFQKATVCHLGSNFVILSQTRILVQRRQGPFIPGTRLLRPCRRLAPASHREEAPGGGPGAAVGARWALTAICASV